MPYQEGIKLEDGRDVSEHSSLGSVIDTVQRENTDFHSRRNKGFM